ncbi:hypothetical protein I3271_00910 [Photobacterium leiognathi]|uniref:hypothetical protein n=1 Tax=Photobacterium leiognathi TaxID=553611 RepID=UPI001EDFC3D1|nr:hypothetical protein [Photobacterium leiognathi]MCG3883242.1 hypothetical protein [Photobacterium leiognathi]
MSKLINTIASNLGISSKVTVSKSGFIYKLNDHDYCLEITGLHKSQLIKNVEASERIKLHIRAVSPVTAFGVEISSSDSISISSTRTVSAIAKDIENRIIPAAREVYKSFMEINAKEAKLKEDMDYIEDVLKNFATLEDNARLTISNGQSARVTYKLTTNNEAYDKDSFFVVIGFEPNTRTVSFEAVVNKLAPFAIENDKTDNSINIKFKSLIYNQSLHKVTSNGLNRYEALTLVELFTKSEFIRVLF